MKVLILNWKDTSHPQAGGAEYVMRKLALGLKKNGYKVSILTSMYKNAKAYEIDKGIEIFRIGSNKYTHSIQAMFYYARHLRGQYDVIIECVNTAPYLANLWRKNERVFLFYHQLAEKVWFFETNRILAALGYWILEPLATRLQAVFNTQKVLTISASTKSNLQKYGFGSSEIKIIPQFFEPQKVDTIPSKSKHEFIFLVVSSLRSMKRVDLAIDAFASLEIDAKLWIVGDGDQMQSLKNQVVEKRIESKVKFWGHVSEATKYKIMRQAHCLLVTSAKEGWGLTITEAANFYTPAIGFDVDGVRDAIVSDQTGILVPDADVDKFANAMVTLVKDQKLLQQLSQNAYKHAQTFGVEQSVDDVENLINPKHVKFYESNQKYTEFLQKQPSDVFEKYADKLAAICQGEKILDIGCGTGETLTILRDKYSINAKGVDVSTTSVALCRSRGLDCDVCGSKFDFEDNCFDVVGSYNVLEHVDNVDQMLNESLRVLKPGGFLVCVCPNFLAITNNFHYKTAGIWQKLKNFYHICHKLVGRNYRFEKMQPIIRTGEYMPDDDAINLTNPIDIYKWASAQNLKLIYYSSNSVYPKSKIKKFVDYTFLKIFFGSQFMVFEKPKHPTV